MGHLIEKYTEGYFLREGESGETLPYGVEGIESFRKGELREHDQEILEHIDFFGANVIEFGFGRGETIKYVWEQRVGSYTGVDFSEAACRIARDFLDRFSITGPRIVCSDAVEFARSYPREHLDAGHQPIDVVMMLDFVEHVPRSELSEILVSLKPCLAATAVVVVNTPDFLFDNDVIADGLNEQGRDSSDFVAETQGMHCNRYTLDSLRRFFSDLGYQAVSRGHYFVLATKSPDDWKGEVSYRQCWNEAMKRGCRLKAEWPRESFEITHSSPETPALKNFHKGNLSGISLYVTRGYEEYYENGSYDDFLTSFIARFDLSGQTVFDIGSFVGVNAMQFAGMVGLNGMVCAFEPNPFNRDRLRLNLSENPHLDERVRVFPFAVSDQGGRANFRLHRNVDAGISSASYMDGAHTTLAEQTLADLGFMDVTVDVCTIDAFVEHTGHVPSCMKIDIEGAEHLALFGAARTLTVHRPVLLMELHSIFCAVTVVDTLVSLGYAIQLLHVEPDGRCFIGAKPAVEVSATAEAVISQRAFETLRSELASIQQKAGADAARLRASTQENAKLTEALTAANDVAMELNSQLTGLRQCFDEQQTSLATAQASLLRYQLFPPIRLARKLKRILRMG